MDYGILRLEPTLLLTCLVGKNSLQCLWAGMHPRAKKSPQSSLPDYQES